jgi:hypothetical protein
VNGVRGATGVERRLAAVDIERYVCSSRAIYRYQPSTAVVRP